METPADRLLVLRERLEAAARKAGREPGEIELMAVSKNFPAPVIREVVESGQLLFGENRVQEAESKIPDLPARLRWHLIGHLQSNKIRKALPLFEAIHSIDSLDIARGVNRVATELGLFPKVYLQANLAEEASKYGFGEQALLRHLDELLALDHLEILGLMTIPPVREDPEESRADFAALRELRDRLATRAGIPLDGLSMGMSDDFPIAIEEGATIVRVGSALFGPRKPTTP
jgi:pyridoxal phosphate enzyme (YggS family)